MASSEQTSSSLELNGFEMANSFLEAEACGDICSGVEKLRRCVTNPATVSKQRPPTELIPSKKQDIVGEDDCSTADERSTRGGDETFGCWGTAQSQTTTSSELPELGDVDDTIPLCTEALIFASLDSEVIGRTRVATAVPLHGDLAIAVSGSSRAEMIDRVRNYFDEAFPAIFSAPPTRAAEDHSWQMSATIFVDYIPLKVEVYIHAAGEDAVNVVMRHPLKSDIVRFTRVFKFLVAFLQSSGLVVQEIHRSECGVRQTVGRLVDDDFDFADGLSADDEPDFGRIDHLLASLESSSAQEREQIFQCLARTAASAPASHVALAQGLANYAVGIESVLFKQPLAPVAEMYPLAAMLKGLACGTSMEARVILSKSIFRTVDKAAAELPWLVASDLAIAGRSLREVALA